MYLLDVPLVGEEHGQTVHTQAPPSGGRQPVLHGFAKSLVVHLQRGVVVTVVAEAMTVALAGGLERGGGRKGGDYR